MNKIRLNQLVVDFLRGKKAVTILLIICGVVSNCLAIFLSLSIGTYYETLSHHNSNKGRILHLFHISLPHKRHYFFMVFLLLIIATTVFQFLFRFGSQHIALDFSFWLRKKLFRHHLRMKMDDFAKKSIGSYLLRYSGDLKSAQSYLEKGFFQFGSDVFFIAIGIFVLFQLHMQASVYAVAGFLVGFSLMQYLGLKIKKLDDERTDMLAANLAYIHETLHGLETIKTWNQEFTVIQKFKKRTDDLHRVSLKTNFWKCLHYVLPFTILFLLLLTVFFTHVRARGEGGASFIPYILQLLLLFPAIKRTMRVSATWKSGMGGLKKIQSILQQPLEKEDSLPDYIPTEGKIEFRNISFSYDNKKQVLNDVSFTCHSGTINCISYQGKTTIFKLLVGLYEPTKGTIFLDGNNLRNFSLKSIRKHIAFCSDHTILQGNTVFKCLFLKKEKYNHDEVHACLRMLHFSMINKNGEFELHQNIGRGATLLSESDYQKLKIARTLLSKKQILLFDGIIEHLETEVQQAVTGYLEKLKRDKTIVISKRSSTGANDNFMFVREEGLANKWN